MSKTKDKTKKELVIVESPAKARTIEKYLGNDFTVMASYGHVRDLLPKTGAVEPDKNFAMHYEMIDKNAKHVEAIRKALKQADTLYLAPDPDREGEAIAWHIYQIMQEKGALKNKGLHRVSFNQITRSAIQEALKNPRQIDMNLVNAQQARRALDYLVGFNLSPLLWRKVQKGLSAGRVQSPALRLIVERESEIEAFKSQEYWSIEASCHFKKHPFNAKLIEYQGDKVERLSIENETRALEMKQQLIKVAKGILVVDKVDKKLRKRQPSAPFVTSTLQQEASRKLGFTTKKTMLIAQQLYEGIDIGDGATGLITYMRTDSVHLANEAISEIREFIVKQYGKENLPDTPREFHAKIKNAQEAHEAIRPTSSQRLPASIKSYLTNDQYKLYDLIWKRAVASQMMHATIDVVSVDLICKEKNRFRVSGSTILHAGFMLLYQEDSDDKKQEDSGEATLPVLQKGNKVDLLDILCHQHFTEPPPRYTEASLVKTLEEYGIGRPSTYASIISTLLQRQYVILERKHFSPTDIGKVVNRFLTEYFTKYVDYDFTAKLEDTLDAVSRGERIWVPVLEDFWEPFKAQVDQVLTNVKRKDVTSEELDEECPECGKPLVIRLSRMGRFIACTGYPDCRYTRSLDEEKDSTPEVIGDRTCPRCNSELQIKRSRYGKFIGCSSYPTCRYTESLEKVIDTGVTCPECAKGTFIKRKSKRGKIFYSCSRYPDCQYSVWNEPIAEICPKCHWPILTLKTTKRRGTEKVCPQKNCGHTEKKVEK